MTEPTLDIKEDKQTAKLGPESLSLRFSGLHSLSLKAFFSNVTAACVMALINITGAVSFGALVFSGPLSSHLAMGVGVFLVGNAIGAILIPFLSSYRANVSSTRAGQAPIFAAIAASIFIAMPDQPTEAVAATVIVGILLGTLISGLVMLALGVMKIGSLVRNIPYPVMGGFFAGLGYLMLVGGVSVAVGPTASTGHLPSFADTTPLTLLAPAILFALALLIVERFITHWSLFPTFMLLSAFAFYGFLFLAGIPMPQATDAHWLPDLVDQENSFWPVISLDQIALVDWQLVLAQSTTFAVLGFLSVVMLLLDVSGIEVVTNQDLDPNRELRAAGLSNVVAGFGGGALAFQSLADVSIVQKLGASSILMSCVYAASCVFVILMGPGLIAFVPNFILGGLLVYVGLGMLRKWVLVERTKLSLPDYAVVLAILFGVVVFGILEGVGIGLALATVLFVHRYSQLDIVRSSLLGSEYVTRTDRSLEDQAYLDSHGSAVRLFILQGFLFFGTANGLLERIKASLAATDKTSARFIVIDFRRVDAIDSSAANAFAKLMQMCKRDGIKIVLSACDAKIKQSISVVACQQDLAAEHLIFVSDLEVGLNWCNDEILSEKATSFVKGNNDAIGFLANFFGSALAAGTVISSFEKIEATANTFLFRQDEVGDALYLLVRGSVAISLETPNEQAVVVRTMKAGALIGEMSLFSGAARSATGVVMEDSSLLRLSKSEFQSLQVKHPAEFSEFNRQIICLMADRLGRANREITALSR